jgi:hypothetical protein
MPPEGLKLYQSPASPNSRRVRIYPPPTPFELKKGEKIY